MSERRATYGGPGWAAREATHDDEIRAGELWAPLAADNGCRRLTDVLLYRPGATIAEVEDIDRALHLRRVDAGKLGAQVDGLIETYESLGVRVHRLPDDGVDDLRHPNAIFLCDVFWQTPFGAVVGRMANPVRAGEERAVAARLAGLGIPVALTIAGDGLLEGADCHWLRPGLALVGTGVRTNKSGYEQLRLRLEGLGARCMSTRIDPMVQHLTGCVQSIAPDHVLVRPEALPAETIPLLRKTGFKVTTFARVRGDPRSLRVQLRGRRAERRGDALRLPGDRAPRSRTPASRLPPKSTSPSTSRWPGDPAAPPACWLESRGSLRDRASPAGSRPGLSSSCSARSACRETERPAHRRSLPEGLRESFEAEVATVEYAGLCDASAVAWIDAERFVVASDEENWLRVYRRGLPEPQELIALDAFLAVDEEHPEADLEAAAVTGDTIWWLDLARPQQEREAASEPASIVRDHAERLVARAGGAALRWAGRGFDLRRALRRVRPGRGGETCAEEPRRTEPRGFWRPGKTMRC